MCASKNARRRRSSSRPTRSSASRPPACAARIYGPTGGSRTSGGPRRWAMSTQGSSRRPAGGGVWRGGSVGGGGAEVQTVKPGQFVVGSFWASDNTCEICRAGYQSACVHRVLMGTLGSQSQYLRVPLADGTLVGTPEVPPADLIPGYLAASDVLGTGWFGAVAAEAGPGKTVA